MKVLETRILVVEEIFRFRAFLTVAGLSRIYSREKFAHLLSVVSHVWYFEILPTHAFSNLAAAIQHVFVY